MRNVRYVAYATVVKHALYVYSLGDVSEQAVDIKGVFATEAVS